MAVVGLYMLCMTGGSGGINRGDLLMLVCAVLFSVHILVIDYFSPMADGGQTLLHPVSGSRSALRVVRYSL